MIAELRTLFWLQWRLTISMFRSRRAATWARLGRMLLMALMLVSSLPFFFGFAVAQGWIATRLPPEAAYELILLINGITFFFWLLLPASYSSEIIERFELTRLFIHPIRFRSLVSGSTLISLLSFAGVWTILILLAQVLGLAWHEPLLLPIILLGAIPTLAILVLAGRLMDDLFDLVAADRRLKGIMVTILMLPFVLLFIGSYALQFATQNYQNTDEFIRPLLANAPSLSELSFTEAFGVVLLYLRPSRFLMWLPVTWGSAGMALPVSGHWARGLFFLALAWAAAGVMLTAHAAITRRLMRGSALRSGSERVRSQLWSVRLPGPGAFGALLAKDWAYLRRSPITRRSLLGTPLVALAFGFAMWQVSTALQAGNPLRQTAPILATALLCVAVNLSTSNFTSNYFGAVDREGFSTMMLSPIDRRLVLLSSNLIMFLFSMTQTAVLLIIVAFASRTWIVLPYGLLMGLCLNVSTFPAYNFASIVGPYRVHMEWWNKNQGNLWVLIAWVVGTPPVMLMFVLPYLLWQPGLAITIPLAILFSGGMYLGTLSPLAKYMDRRTRQILETVSTED